MGTQGHGVGPTTSIGTTMSQVLDEAQGIQKGTKQSLHSELTFWSGRKTSKYAQLTANHPKEIR